jgi:hypothetical protein
MCNRCKALEHIWAVQRILRDCPSKTEKNGVTVNIDSCIEQLDKAVYYLEAREDKK